MSFSYPENVRFQCLKCALCCGDTKTRVRHVLLLKMEAERISQATSKPIEELAVKIEDCEPYVYEMRKTAKERKCVFLKEKHCTIYALRPLICRFYPFELKNTKNGKYEFLYTKECLGIGKGKRLKKSYFRNLFQRLTTSNKHTRQHQESYPSHF